MLGVHAVPADAADLAELFGGETGDEVDKFERAAWHDVHGVPILDRCQNWFVGRVLERFDAGDHDAYLLEPVRGRIGRPGRVHLPSRETDRSRPRGLTSRSYRLTAADAASPVRGVASRTRCHRVTCGLALAAGDRDARERLIEQHMPLARSLAAQYRHAREPLEDLCQVANLGLVKAVDRFDPARGIAFTSYAVPTILGELKRHFRDRTWTIHVSRSVQEALARVEKATEALRQDLGRYPSAREVARALPDDASKR